MTLWQMQKIGGSGRYSSKAQSFGSVLQATADVSPPSLADKYWVSLSSAVNLISL